MDRIDFKRTLPQLYAPKPGMIHDLMVPDMAFIMVDGAGNPNTSPDYAAAIAWLYGVSYAVKFAAKADLARDYVVPPLEGLWWADDPADFVVRNKDRWRWTMMLMCPDFVGPDMVAAGIAKTVVKRGAAPPTLRMQTYREGRCLQLLHLGSYDDEAPVLANLHDVVMPERGLTFAGHHHEIYLSDARKVAPSRLKTILRQPVRPA